MQAIEFLRTNNFRFIDPSFTKTKETDALDAFTNVKVSIIKDGESIDGDQIAITEQVIAIINYTEKVWAKIADTPEGLEFNTVKLEIDNNDIIVSDAKNTELTITLQESYDAEPPFKSNKLQKTVIFTVVVFAVGFFAYQMGLLPIGSKAQKV